MRHTACLSDAPCQIIRHGWEIISLHRKSNRTYIIIPFFTLAKVGHHQREVSLILFIGDVVKSPAQEIRGVAQSVRSHLKASAGLEHFCAVVTAGNPHTGVGRVRVSQAVEKHHLAPIYSEHLANSQTLFTVHLEVVGAI